YKEAAKAGHEEAKVKLAEIEAEVARNKLDNQLLIAAETGDITALGVLIEQGAEVNKKIGWNGGSALHAAVENSQLAMVKALLKAEADIYLADDSGLTSIHSTAWQGNLEILEDLFAAGAADGIHMQDKSGH